MYHRMLIKLVGLEPMASQRCLVWWCRPIASAAKHNIAALASANTNAATVAANNNNNNININNNNDNINKASPDQLVMLQEQMADHLPMFFARPHRFNLYTLDLLFIDNIRGIRTQGLYKYAFQISLVKMYYFLRYSTMKLELLNIANNPEESYIKIRWRVITKPGIIQMVLFFWKFRSMEKWKDGISTMYANKEGKIYCHVCDNIDVETDDIGNKQKQSIKNPLVSRGLNV